MGKKNRTQEPKRTRLFRRAPHPEHLPNPFPSTCILRALSRTPETTRRSPLLPHPRLCKDSPQTRHPPHLHFFQTTHMSTFHQTSVRAVFPRLRLASSNRIPLLRP